MTATPPSRNAPCPCGSGRRFKACHGALAVQGPSSADAAAAASAVLQEALAHQSAGRVDEAEARYRRALALEPASFDALHMLGVLRHQRGDPDEAVALIGRAIALYTGHAPAYSNLALALLARGRAEDALASLDRAIALQPDLVEAWSNRGHALVRLLRHGEAVQSFERALALDPRRAGVLSNLGNALLELRRSDAAADVFGRLVAVEPGCDWAIGTWLASRLACCDWDDFATRRDEVLAAVRAGRRAIAPFSLLAIADAPDEHLRCATTYVHAAGQVPALPPRAPRGATRIRLGYLSSDFRDHAMGYLMADLLETHDRSRFEVVAFSHGPPSDAPIRRRLERACDAFLDVRTLGDADLAARLREHAVDIAIDLNGLTQGARSGVLARRPAPVQVAFLGYPGTTGMRAIDYAIGDARVIPPGSERFFAERVVRLPDCYFVCDRRRPLPDGVPSRAEAGLPADGFVFACFNNNYKILPATFDRWMRLLRAVDGSVLWLLADNEAAARHLRMAARARGVAPERIAFAPRVPLARHIARHALVDLCVDTLPYNGHTTTSDALWAGVPVLATPGRSFASRVAASLLVAAGLPELVARTPDACDALALELARAPARLAELKARIVASRATCALFDTDRHRRALEQAYATMWARHLRGDPPEGFDVPPVDRAG